MKLNNESKTLFIPLYGKAIMSKNKLFINDPKAEEIIDNIDYDFAKLKQSKWLSMYMALRAKIIDEICCEYLKKNTNTTVIHIGCGLDSRCLRIKNKFVNWYDVDYDSVIEIRKKFYMEDNNYHMIGKSVVDYTWLNQIDSSNNVLIIAEGLIMYLTEEEIKELLFHINKKFRNVHLIFDAYSKKGVKYSKIKNPVNKMNAAIKYGMDNQDDFLLLNNNLEYTNSYLIKNDKNNLNGLTKLIFNKIYCGKISQSMYKIYEFNLKSHD